MALTDINSDDRLVQQTFAEHLEEALGWESVYAYNNETFGPVGTLGRINECEVVLVRYCLIPAEGRLMSGVSMQTIFAKWLVKPLMKNRMQSRTRLVQHDIGVEATA